MADAYWPGNSNQDVVEIVFPDTGYRVSEFVEYSFNSHFLTPTDGFYFVIDSQAKATDGSKHFDAFSFMKPGASVELHLNGSVQATGFIDAVEVSASREGGIVYHIEGRDVLSQAVDACSDPTVSIKEGQPMDEALLSIFLPFSFTEFVISNDDNRDLRTNAFRSKTRTSDGRGFGRRALKEYKAHQTRPYPREGVFEFASRISQRFGLWIWASADGKRLIVDKPNFDQAPEVQLGRRFNNPRNNILGGTVRFDVSEQPTAIVADTYSKSGEFGPGRIKTIYRNAAVRVDEKAGPPPYQKYIDAGAEVLDVLSFDDAAVMTVPRHRVLYLHDDESATAEHLACYVKREMALLQRKSLTAKYTVEGHGQETPYGYRSWAVDTTVHVFDEAADVDEIMYVLSRTYRKSRDGGTTTDLELIRLHTLEFTDPGK